jgi:transcription-repair coupling factor (superfamily II helicase)
MDASMMEPDQTDQNVAHATRKAFVEGVTATRERAEVLGLVGASGAYLLSGLLAACAETMVVVTADQKQAEHFAADLEFCHGRAGEVFLFPAWEVGPYEPLQPHPEVEAERLAALAALHEGRARVLVVPVRALLQRVIPRQVLGELCEHLVVGEEYPRQGLLARLQELGYQAVSLVEDRGTFSVRGDLLDIYPPTRTNPVRIEFFGDDVERMRPFDPGSQRSQEQELEELMLLPSRELVLAGEHLETFVRRLKERCDALDLPRSVREAVLEEVREGILAPGRAFLLPCNYDRLDTLFAYTGQARWVLVDPPAVEQETDRFATEIRDGEARAAGREEPFPAAGELYLTPAELEAELAQRPRIDFSALELFRMTEGRTVYRLRAEGNGDLRRSLKEAGDGLGPLAERLQGWLAENWRVLIACHQRGQAERLADLLQGHGLALELEAHGSLRAARPGHLALTVGNLTAGFRLPDERLAVIAEEEIFGPRVRRRDRGAARAKALLSSLAELRENDYVVHTDHGIARYRGLVHLVTGATEGDYLLLEYAGDDRLYVPVDRIEKISKYVGGEGHQPRLDKMGGQGWEKAKLRARAAVEELARELLRIYARRAMNTRAPYPAPDRDFREFEASFPYEETGDQLAAIDDVLADLQAEKSMDRLICGDVGYGKTEVAIRGAFKVAMDGRQVAVLVPTTVLARQHWETFRERFAGTPVEVEMVSRFRSAAEQKRILERTAAGRVDVLIGTHRLLQRDVKFKDLGLVIVD